MIYEILGTAAMILAIIGVVLNNHKLISCFYLFLISNSICLYLHLHVNIWSMCVRDVVFIMLAFHGIYKWRRKELQK